MRKIVFLTGTRADFGKLKSLIEVTNNSELFEVHIFATGMHMLSVYGYTVAEIEKCGYPNIYKHINQVAENSMDVVLAKTIESFSFYCREIDPDLIVVHGDRVEALAGAIAGALSNKLVAHIEGGEVSGTIDELIRHSVSKMSHTHFVSNDMARKRLIQMGEEESSISVIGSPDVDLMFSKDLPAIEEVRAYYDIPLLDYGILMYHPVTTEFEHVKEHVRNLVDAVIESNLNFVVVYPNNDLGSKDIIREYQRFKDSEKIRMFPSIRFEYFLTLLKNSKFMVGNSSAGIREAPYYGIPTVNIGSRQTNRSLSKEIINTDNNKDRILAGIKEALGKKPEKVKLFGDGRSDEKFLEVISDQNFWSKSKQKHFLDLIFDVN